MRPQSQGFTLFDLLLIVAFVAILGAIAAPVYHQAQTRSRMAKVIADFRQIGKALEAYAVDNHAYPLCTNPLGDYIVPASRRLKALTSPVAYLSPVPMDDPFRPAGLSAGMSSYEYFDAVGVEGRFGGDAAVMNAYFMICSGRPVEPVDGPLHPGIGPKWLLQSRGPDMMLAWEAVMVLGQTYEQATVFYDPTNGTISAGDVFHSQIKSSFQ